MKKAKLAGNSASKEYAPRWGRTKELFRTLWYAAVQ